MAGYTYTKINWENEPSYNTPINETNLNHMDQGIFDLAYVKAEKEDAVFVNSISLDRKAGTSVGLDSVAAGYDTEASGVSSVAIGSNTSAKNGQAVAGGFNSKAWGNTSLAFGTNCITRLNAAESQAIGKNCIAGSANQMVFGQYNVEDTTGTYAEIVGNGSSGSESNARTLDWQGNETIAGDFTNGNGETLHGIYEALPTDTESGNPAVITDAFGGACKSLKLTLEPIQSGSGTPSPQNVRPISGRNSAIVRVCGKNMQKIADCINRATIDSDGSIGASSNFKVYYVKVLKGITYTITTQDNTAVVYAFYNSQPTSGAVSYDNARILDYNSLEHSTFVAPITGFLAYRAVNAFTKPQVEIGSSATSYSDFSHLTDYTIQLGQTVYGGVLDVTSGVLTITYALIDLGDLTWGKSSSGNRFYTNLSTPYKWSDSLVMYCSAYAFDGVGNSNRGYYGADKTFRYYWLGSGNLSYELYIANEDYSSAEAFAISVVGYKLCYELATPTTVQLTAEEVPLLKGDNVLTTDADSIEASYSADIALYIEKKIAEGSQNNRSLSKGGSGDEEVKEEEKKEEEEIEEPKKEETR